MDTMIHTTFNGRNVFVRSERSAQDIDVYNEVICGDCYKLSLIKSVYTPKIIVDVGAHIGTFSLLAKSIWPQSTIYAVEPEPDNVELLRANLSGYTDAIVVDGAIAYQPDIVLVVAQKATGGNHIASANTHVDSVSYKKLAKLITVYRLSELTPRVDCLKMDCEGGEYGIFEFENPVLLQAVKMSFGEYHGSLARFKPAIEKAMPQMQMFYTGPGNTQPTIESRIGNFWGFSKEIVIPQDIFLRLKDYVF